MADADAVPEKSVRPALIKTDDGEFVGSEPELTLDALPDTVLVHLCSYLVDDDGSADAPNKFDALDSFRKTCSATASAVNSYLQKASNLPDFPALIEDSGRTTYLTANFRKPALLLHPIRYVGGFIGRDPRKCGLRGQPDIWTIRRKLKTLDAIEIAAQTMVGHNVSGDRFKIRCGRKSDFSRVALLLSKFGTILRLNVKIKELNEITATNILDVVRVHGVKDLALSYNSWSLSDPQQFILDASSLVGSFALMGNRPPGPMLLDIPLHWWKTYLIEHFQADKGVLMHGTTAAESRHVLYGGIFAYDDDSIRSITGLERVSWWEWDLFYGDSAQ